MSPTQNLKPIILLAFAKDAEQHLPLLEKESRDIRTIFGELGEQKERVEIVDLENADLAALSRELTAGRERVVIFHYGGHADPESLRLKDGSGYIHGLSKMLGKMPKLKLVFLNGCATKDQVDFLLRENVKAVIATRVAVGDQAAYEFSKAFYESFAKGNSLKASYEHACDFLMFKYKNLLQYQINKRSIGLDAETEDLTDEAKWALFYNDPDVLLYRGVGTETDKVQADAALIGLINSFSEKIPIRILLAVSVHQKLPNGAISPVNVYNEIALIKEYIYKLFIYSNLSEKFDVQVYLLQDQKRASLIVSSTEEAGSEREVDLPDLTGFHLISWVIWNNLGSVDPEEEAPLSWLYREVFDLEESQRPGLQLFRRGEAIPDFVTDHPNQQGVIQQARAVEAFFAGISGTRIIDYHPDLFEEEFEHHLRIWLKNFVRKVYRSQDPPMGKAAPAVEFRNPYKGLKPYQYEDANLFFGRINEVDGLREQLADPQHEGLLAVIGASGSGKSSLVRAGLFNRLKLNAIPGSRKWRILECEIKESRRLECREVWGANQLKEQMGIPLDQFMEKGREGAVLLIRKWMHDRPASARLVLFFDQFEEVFTLVEDAREAFRAALLHFLVEFARSDQGQVILTMRSEYFHRCLDYPDFAHFLKTGQQVVLPPNRESMIRIIVRPAMFSGLRFEKGLEMKVWEDAGQVEGTLPLVSYVLEQLAKTPEGNMLTFRSYQALGGVVGVIQKQADLAVRNFNTESEAFQKDFNFLFRKLIKVGNDGLVGKRPAPLDTDHWPPGAVALKNELIDKRLLISSGNTLEIAHEALIKHWDLLKVWILEVKSALLTLAKAGQEAADWHEDRQAKKSAEEKLLLDRTRLWPHERLQAVYDAQELLGIDDEELEKLYPHSRAFIRREYERLLEELEHDFVDHQRRDDIGNRLAVLGDQRPGVGVKNGLPEIVWCKVPAGQVWVEGVDQIFEVSTLYISKYPITLAQFNLFTQPRVYFQDQWWEGLPVKHETYKPKTQSPEHMTNRPAEWVNWYHAVAYCRWLSAQLGFIVRLPYEWEWQQAACHGTPENIYPWGKQWDVNKANSSEGIGRLMAVGLYVQGMAGNGAMDMAGNVYEWCYNAYELDNPSLEITTHRTTKGGSWGKIGGDAQEVLKNTYRYKDYPSGINERGNDIRAGFRLVAESLPESALLQDI